MMHKTPNDVRLKIKSKCLSSSNLPKSKIDF